MPYIRLTYEIVILHKFTENGSGSATSALKDGIARWRKWHCGSNQDKGATFNTATTKHVYEDETRLSAECS